MKLIKHQLHVAEFVKVTKQLSLQLMFLLTMDCRLTRLVQ